MKRKVEFNLRVVLLIALPLLLFSYLASAGVFAAGDPSIPASVTVAPTTRVECKPDTLIVGSSVSWINCFIEMDNADVNNIAVNTVKLGITSASCSVFADPLTFSVADFDNDGKPDAMVRFSRSSADAVCFGPPASTTIFTLVVSGQVSSIPFSGTDSLLYIKTCQDAHVHGMQANTTTTGGQIITLKDGTFDLSLYSPRTYSLNGFFDCRNNRIIGDMKFFTKGTLTEPTVIFGRLRLPQIFDKKRPVQVSVVFDTLDNCAADPATKHVECVGKGVLFIDKEQPFSRERISLKTIRVEINGNKATIQGGDVFNDKVNIQDLQVSKITIKPSLTKI